jgi:hypothetical protein
MLAAFQPSVNFTIIIRTVALMVETESTSETSLMFFVPDCTAQQRRRVPSSKLLLSYLVTWLAVTGMLYVPVEFSSFQIFCVPGIQ